MALVKISLHQVIQNLQMLFFHVTLFLAQLQLCSSFKRCPPRTSGAFIREPFSSFIPSIILLSSANGTLSLFTAGPTGKHKNSLAGHRPFACSIYTLLAQHPVLSPRALVRSTALNSSIFTVDHNLEVMSSLSTSFLSLLENPKYSLLHLWVWVQDRGTFSVGAILGLIVIYTTRYFASPYRKLPPGPRGYPIIGNLLEMRDGQWLKFSEWQKKYGQFVTGPLFSFPPYLNLSLGDLIYLNAAGQPIVVINSPKVGVALLDRRAAIYSDRPRNIVSSLMTGGLFVAFSRYGDT